MEMMFSSQGWDEELLMVQLPGGSCGGDAGEARCCGDGGRGVGVGERAVGGDGLLVGGRDVEGGCKGWPRIGW